MRALAQTQDQLQRQASPSPAQLVAVSSGPDYRTQPILELQRTLGNRAVQRLLGTDAQELGEGSSSTAVGRFTRDVSPAPVVAQAPVKIQHKLAVNAPGDVYEQEADRVAEEVMRMPDPAAPRLQRTAGHQVVDNLLGSNTAKVVMAAAEPLITNPNDRLEQAADRQSSKLVSAGKPKSMLEVSTSAPPQIRRQANDQKQTEEAWDRVYSGTETNDSGDYLVAGISRKLEGQPQDLVQIVEPKSKYRPPEGWDLDCFIRRDGTAKKFRGKVAYLPIIGTEELTAAQAKERFPQYVDQATDKFKAYPKKSAKQGDTLQRTTIVSSFHSPEEREAENAASAFIDRERSTTVDSSRTLLIPSTMRSNANHVDVVEEVVDGQHAQVSRMLDDHAVQINVNAGLTNPAQSRAEAARQMVAKLKNAGAVYRQERHGRNWTDYTVSDCSKFVQWSLEQAGQGQVLGRENATTTLMRKVIDQLQDAGQALRPTSPQVGDIMVWEGHVGIVTDVGTQDGNDYLEFAAMGLGGASLIGKYTTKEGDQRFSLKVSEVANRKNLGRGQFLGYWTPP